MAVSVNTNWDIRPATGSDSVNSGGFVSGTSGTDYSQQTSPQYTLTGVTTTGASAILLTASASADMVGNIGLLVSGTNATVGRYQILSVVAGVSITVDRNATTGVGASIAFNIGGSVATFATPYAASVAGNKFYLKGTLTVTAVQTLTYTPGSAVNATELIGYTTTHGDGGNATYTTATNSTDLFATAAQSGYGFYNVTFSNTATTRARGFFTGGGPSRDFYFENCVFDGFTTAIKGDFATIFQLGTSTLFGCTVKNCTGAGILVSGSISVLYSYIHNNTGAGLQVQTGGDTGTLTTINGSVFYSNGSNGFLQDVDQNPGTTRAVTISNSDFVSNTGAGVKLGSTGGNEYGAVITNCILYGNSTYGIDYDGAFLLAENRVTNCAFGANTTAPIHNFTGDIGSVTLSGDPFNGRTSNDFSLNSTAGAGAACKGAGYPGVTIFGTGFIDIGALQTSGGGSVTNVFVPAGNIFIFDTEVEG
jgi:hypothetical protein